MALWFGLKPTDFNMKGDFFAPDLSFDDIFSTAHFSECKVSITDSEIILYGILTSLDQLSDNIKEEFTKSLPRPFAIVAHKSKYSVYDFKAKAKKEIEPTSLEQVLIKEWSDRSPDKCYSGKITLQAGAINEQMLAGEMDAYRHTRLTECDPVDITKFKFDGNQKAASYGTKGGASKQAEKDRLMDRYQFFKGFYCDTFLVEPDKFSVLNAVTSIDELEPGAKTTFLKIAELLMASD